MILKTLPFEISEYEPITETSFKVKWENRRYFLKMYRYNDFHFYLDYIRGDKHICFENEVWMNSILGHMNGFYIPKLVKTDCKSYAMYEYLETTGGVDSYQLMTCLIELHQQDVYIPLSRIKRLWSNLFRAVPLKIILWSRYASSARLKIIKEGLFALFYKKHRKPLLLHYDLFNSNNVLNHEEKGLCLHDLEFVHYEYKWLLIDIVDICFDRQNFEMNSSLFKAYLFALNREDLSLNDIKYQVKIILLRRLLGGIKVGDIDKKDATSFIKDVLLSPQYDQWFKDNTLH